MLPLELKYLISSHLTIRDIELSMPHLLKSVNIWKMLFKRDFPLHNEITHEYQKNYEYYDILGKFSLIFGSLLVPEDILIFIKTCLTLDQIITILSLIHNDDTSINLKKQNQILTLELLNEIYKFYIIDEKISNQIKTLSKPKVPNKRIWNLNKVILI